MGYETQQIYLFIIETFHCCILCNPLQQKKEKETTLLYWSAEERALGFKLLKRKTWLWGVQESTNGKILDAKTKWILFLDTFMMLDEKPVVETETRLINSMNPV